MLKTTQILSKLAHNGVVSMQELRVKNLRLLRLLESNFERIADRLQREYEVSILQDLQPVTDENNIKLFLKYHYGDSVNLTDLRERHRSVYRVLPARDVLKDWGFEITYDGITTEEMLVAELNRIVKSRGALKINDELYGKLAYRARRAHLTVREYLNSLGFPTPVVDIEEIVRLRDREKRSFREIELITGVPKSTAQKYYQKHRREVRE